MSYEPSDTLGEDDVLGLTHLVFHWRAEIEHLKWEQGQYPGHDDEYAVLMNRYQVHLDRVTKSLAAARAKFVPDPDHLTTEETS